MMPELFNIDPVLPPGFTYIPEFITEGEERNLLEAVAGIELDKLIFQGFEARRKVTSFGYDYNFDKRTISKGRDIPPVFHSLVDATARFLSIPSHDIAELLLTEYPPGSVINWHRDAPPFDLIAGISLMADCVFRLRPHEKEKQGKKAIFSLPVLRRSLYIMKGVARSEWQHSISPVKETRYSITLRTLIK